MIQTMMHNWAELLAAAALLINAVVAVIGLWRVQRSVNIYHLAVNSRLDELLHVTKQAAHAAGVKEEADRQRIQRENGGNVL
jgi:hypothetical protein